MSEGENEEGAPSHLNPEWLDDCWCPLSFRGPRARNFLSIAPVSPARGFPNAINANTGSWIIWKISDNLPCVGKPDFQNIKDQGLILLTLVSPSQPDYKVRSGKSKETYIIYWPWPRTIFSPAMNKVPGSQNWGARGRQIKLWMDSKRWSWAKQTTIFSPDIDLSIIFDVTRKTTIKLIAPKFQHSDHRSV